MALKMRKNKSPQTPSYCPLTQCMSLIGGAWTVNIIWHLTGGPRRFSELKLDIPPISPKVLTTRLRELEEHALITRDVKPTSPPSVEYTLTNLGRELIPAIEAIVAVGHKLKDRQSQQASHAVQTGDMGQMGSDDRKLQAKSA